MAGLGEPVAEPAEDAVDTGQKGQKENGGQKAQGGQDFHGPLPGGGRMHEAEKKGDAGGRNGGDGFRPPPRPDDGEDEHTGQEQQAGPAREEVHAFTLTAPGFCRCHRVAWKPGGAPAGGSPKWTSRAKAPPRDQSGSGPGHAGSGVDQLGIVMVWPGFIVAPQSSSGPPKRSAATAGIVFAA
ncbi:hypothetical protein GCM10017567_64810 [Amycolatopsis bullii]|uniref:Uncharacterized protein n=1 Tax=Amycolatopsis bullii TaxID=941987 RepID=A0ABQ3KLF2_9PSEU|nr:hypothetical protein GCM10017567_64810 [Amycolatopsis bullii]